MSPIWLHLFCSACSKTYCNPRRHSKIHRAYSAPLWQPVEKVYKENPIADYPNIVDLFFRGLTFQELRLISFGFVARPRIVYIIINYIYIHLSKDRQRYRSIIKALLHCPFPSLFPWKTLGSFAWSRRSVSWNCVRCPSPRATAPSRTHGFRGRADRWIAARRHRTTAVGVTVEVLVTAMICLRNLVSILKYLYIYAYSE